MLSPSRLAPLAVLLLTLSACGGEDGSEPGPDREPQDTSGQEVLVDSLDLTFHVPNGWVTFEASAPPSATDPVLRSVAERLEVKPAVFAERIASGAMMQLYSDQPAPQGLLDSATVIGLLIRELPDEAALENQLDELGAVEVDIRRADTAAGEALVVHYELGRTDAVTVYGEAAYLDVGREVAVITVSSVNQDRATELGRLVLDSVDVRS